MSADDQAFLDYLSSVPNQIWRYSGNVADSIDKHVEAIAEKVRDTLSTVEWLPDAIRRPPPPPPAAPIIAMPLSTLERLQACSRRYKIMIVLVVLSTGALCYQIYQKTRGRKRRSARRARNGGRMEVVVMAGCPALPLTRALSLDLERRGFIVYMVSSCQADESMIQNLSRPDIKPLAMDLTDAAMAARCVERFTEYLSRPHAPVPKAKAHHLCLAGLILVPSLTYQTSPIATIPPSSFADLFNTHLLKPVLTVQAFLPLLTGTLHPPAEQARPKVLVLTPSIISSINPPFHAPEATVCSALSAFTDVLAAELRPLSIRVTHLQLGSFDLAGFTPTWSSTMTRPAGNGLPTDGSETTLAWSGAERQVYGRNFVNQSASALGAGRIRGLRASSLRELHDAVFDVLDGSTTGGRIRVGMGAGTYGFVGRWVPRGLVAWMMGIRRVGELTSWQPSSADGPCAAISESGEVSADSADSAESFVAVPSETADAHVWKEC